mgnify:CR=1 FL=1
MKFLKGHPGLKGKDNPASWPQHKAALSAGQKKRYAGHSVSLRCEQCGREFLAYLSNIKRRGVRFCSWSCSHMWRKTHIYPKWRANRVPVQCMYCSRQVMVPRCKVNTVKFCSIKCRNHWDSEHPNHLLLHLPRPNKAETRLDGILRTHFPNEWEYTGDGRVVLNGSVPDFTNKNGRKAVIELFGEFWHSQKRAKSWKDTELGKIMLYNSLGFDCLVIWEGELKDEQYIILKLLI